MLRKYTTLIRRYPNGTCVMGASFFFPFAPVSWIRLIFPSPQYLLSKTFSRFPYSSPFHLYILRDRNRVRKPKVAGVSSPPRFRLRFLLFSHPRLLPDVDTLPHARTGSIALQMPPRKTGRSTKSTISFNLMALRAWENGLILAMCTSTNRPLRTPTTTPLQGKPLGYRTKTRQ